MIDNTTVDLQQIWEQTDKELAQPLTDAETASLSGISNLSRSAVEEEKENIDYCLNICRHVANHLERVQTEISENPTIRATGRDRSPPQTWQSQARLVTSEKLRDCKTGIRFTISELQVRLQDADHRLQKLLYPTRHEGGIAEDIPSSQQSHEDLETVRQCLSICDEATQELARDRINVFEEVHMADDGHQVIVATLGDLISARKISAGARSTQWLGQMSDASLQQLSKDNVSSGDITVTRDPADNVVGEDTLPNISTNKTAGIRHYRFEGRHGTGRTLG